MEEGCLERLSLHFKPFASAAKFGQRWTPFEDDMIGDDRPDKAGNKQGGERIIPTGRWWRWRFDGGGGEVGGS